MNSKLYNICTVLGLSAAIKINDWALDLNDISSIDSYTPSRFMDGIEKIGTPDELISTFADMKLPGELIIPSTP